MSVDIAKSNLSDKNCTARLSRGELRIVLDRRGSFPPAKARRAETRYGRTNPPLLPVGGFPGHPPAVWTISV